MISKQSGKIRRELGNKLREARTFAVTMSMKNVNKINQRVGFVFDILVKDIKLVDKNNEFD